MSDRKNTADVFVIAAGDAPKLAVVAVGEKTVRAVI